jgi:hypothetical protein
LKKIQRNYRYNVIDTGTSSSSYAPGRQSPFNNNRPGPDIRCHGCHERNYLFQLEQDPENLFCTNCGAKTPVVLEHPTGGDVIGTLGNELQDQQPAVVQSQSTRAADRQPTSMLKKKPSMIEDYINQHGWELKDSYTIDRNERT